MPRRSVLLGGGFIAAEFAHIAARAGAHVTVIEQLDRMLTPFDPDLVAWLVEKFRAIGIDVRLQTRVTAIERRADGLSVRAISNGKDQVFEADLVVHADGVAVGETQTLEIDSEQLQALLIAEAALGEKLLRAMILPRVMKCWMRVRRMRYTTSSSPARGARDWPPPCTRAQRVFRSWLSTHVRSAVRPALVRASKITSVFLPASRARRSPGAATRRHRSSGRAC